VRFAQQWSESTLKITAPSPTQRTAKRYRYFLFNLDPTSLQFSTGFIFQCVPIWNSAYIECVCVSQMVNVNFIHISEIYRNLRGVSTLSIVSVLVVPRVEIEPLGLVSFLSYASCCTV